MIFILTAAIQSGKTTSLIKWSEKRNDVYGILTPVIEGKRVFMNAASKEQFAMEAIGNEERLIVGRFSFSRNGFKKAIAIIQDAIDKEGWLIIDEIGPLELRGEGFYNVVKEVLAKREKKIILVVREGMAEQVENYFSVKGTVINTIAKIL